MKQTILNYLDGIQALLAQMDAAEIERLVMVLHDARLRGQTVFLCGNGGSAATASHWANDLCKGALADGLPRLRAIALTDNVPLITAWANDTAYDQIFSAQLANLVRPQDVVIAISGSGNSPTVLKGIETAREAGALTVGLTGFAGGRLKQLADLAIVVPSNSMEQIEDVHLVLTHCITSTLRAMPQRPAAINPQLAAEPA